MAMTKKLYVEPSMRVRETFLEVNFLATGDYSGNIEPIGEDDWGTI